MHLPRIFTLLVLLFMGLTSTMRIAWSQASATVGPLFPRSSDPVPEEETAQRPAPAPQQNPFIPRRTNPYPMGILERGKGLCGGSAQILYEDAGFDQKAPCIRATNLCLFPVKFYYNFTTSTGIMHKSFLRLDPNEHKKRCASNSESWYELLSAEIDSTGADDASNAL
jgi:hypothetical protein